MVGPCRIAFGTVIAAGTIFRKDQLRPDRLVFEGNAHSGSVPFTPGGFRNLKRVLVNNFIYIGNLLALEQWYRHVRSIFVGHVFSPELLDGLFRVLDLAIAERIKQLKILSEKIGASAPRDGIQSQFVRHWTRIEDRIVGQRKKQISGSVFEDFMKCLHAKKQEWGASYTDVIKQLTPGEAGSGSAWLDECVLGLLTEIERELSELKVLQVWNNG